MKRAILLIFLTFAASASAWELDVGAVGIGHTSVYRDTEAELLAIPYAEFRSQYVFITLPTAGVHIINTKPLVLDAKVSYHEGFRPNSSTHEGMRELDRRSANLAAGGGIKLRSFLGTLEFDMLADVRNQSNGASGKLQYSIMLPVTERFFIMPKFGVEWNNTKHNDYYYGISNAESARSGLASYEPERSRSRFVSLDVMYAFADRGYVLLGGGYKRLDEEIKDSPMIDEKGQVEGYFGILYRFGDVEKGHGH
jgi:outer membrane protein